MDDKVPTTVSAVPFCHLHLKTITDPSCLCRTPALRRIEATAAGQPLMQRAGRAAAELAARLCRDDGGVILVLAGPGNNGGDAFEAARCLHEWHFTVHVVFPGDPARLPPDAAAAYARFTGAGLQTQPDIPAAPRWSLIIDGLFGIGLSRAIVSPYAELIEQANCLAAACRCPLLALDCPSGLNADTGGSTGTAIRASHTISFIAGKPGLYTADGPDLCGKISIDALGLNAENPEITASTDRSARAAETTDKATPASGHLTAIQAFAHWLRPRARNSHKGSYGSVGILGGAAGMAGAALLAGRAALRLGSGRVYVGLLDTNAPAFDPAQVELMLRTPEALLTTDLSVLACGPGLGVSPAAHALLLTACTKARTQTVPLVLDADALNLIAAENAAGGASAGSLTTALAARQAPTLLTPHPAEAARLLNCTTQTIQADRIAAACTIAGRFRAWVALKGCGTVIASPDGRWQINPSGNPGLATAGSGDVLTGLIAALLAQGWPAEAALPAAVHLHGAAADRLAANGIGPIGLTAGELIDSARYCFNQWISENSQKISGKC